ncbi:transcription factor Sox-3 isoform X2 [Chanodichthys erythropterus]|uniref:transcription factor Sox-3 isoform X2 n=1 Tax=Chanodichthys erythropterus TaxID=933992 RepID=UPI00351E4B86
MISRTWTRTEMLRVKRKSDIKRKEVHYPAEKEANGFHSHHGNRAFSPRQTYNKVDPDLCWLREAAERSSALLIPAEQPRSVLLLGGQPPGPRQTTEDSDKRLLIDIHAHSLSRFSVICCGAFQELQQSWLNAMAPSAGRAWLSAAAEWKTAYPSLSRLSSKRHGLRVLTGSLQLNSMQDLKCREKDLEERLCNGEQIHPQAPNPLSCQQQQVPATVSSNTGRNEIISNPKTHLIIPKVTVLNAYLFSDCMRPRQISKTTGCGHQCALVHYLWLTCTFPCR